jgi:hypothetical protein
METPEKNQEIKKEAEKVSQPEPPAETLIV